jgi:hypothetical protein
MEMKEHRAYPRPSLLDKSILSVSIELGDPNDALVKDEFDVAN